MCYYSMNENAFPIMAQDYSHEQAESGPVRTELKIGDELIVQVVKEDIKTKAPVVSSNLNFTGKYVALTYGKSTIGVSSKINDEKERKRLKEIATAYKSREYGFVIRTNAAYIAEEKISAEIERLIASYKEIRSFGIHKSRFSLLYKTPQNYICDLRDSYTDNVDEFITDDEELYNNMKEYLESYQPEDIDKLSLYQDQQLSLAALYGIADRLSNAIRPMVWLKSGGSLIIQPTEALTVIMLTQQGYIR